jgi:hypothetical protein
VIEELIERFRAIAGIHCGVYEFLQVLNAGVGLRRVFGLELLDVAGAINEKFQDVRRAHLGRREGWVSGFIGIGIGCELRNLRA